MNKLVVCELWSECDHNTCNDGCGPTHGPIEAGTFAFCRNNGPTGRAHEYVSFRPETPLQKTLAHWLRLKVRPGMRASDTEPDNDGCYLCQEYPNDDASPRCAACPWFKAHGDCHDILRRIVHAQCQCQADQARADIIAKLRVLVAEELKAERRGGYMRYVQESTYGSGSSRESDFSMCRTICEFCGRTLTFGYHGAEPCQCGRTVAELPKWWWTPLGAKSLNLCIGRGYSFYGPGTSYIVAGLSAPGGELYLSDSRHATEQTGVTLSDLEALLPKAQDTIKPVQSTDEAWCGHISPQDHMGILADKINELTNAVNQLRKEK